MMQTLLRVALTATLSTAALASVLSARTIAEGESLGFTLTSNPFANGTLSQTWAPSEALLAEQAARMENLYILDPLTNATILNPAHTTNTTLTKRGGFSDFNPYEGAGCRMVFQHHYNIRQCCGGEHCEDCSEETIEFRVLDHSNPDVNFAVMEVDRQGDWEYYQLNNHRGWWGIVNWGWDKWYAIDSAYAHIEGAQTDRDMKGGDWCWYSQGGAWWGYWGEASCMAWCSEFNW